MSDPIDTLCGSPTAWYMILAPEIRELAEQAMPMTLRLRCAECGRRIIAAEEIAKASDRGAVRALCMACVAKRRQGLNLPEELLQCLEEDAKA